MCVCVKTRNVGNELFLILKINFDLCNGLNGFLGSNLEKSIVGSGAVPNFLLLFLLALRDHDLGQG